MSPPDINPAEVCNINVGVMGHVDSGKNLPGFIIVSFLTGSEVAECHSIYCIAR